MGIPARGGRCKIMRFLSIRTRKLFGLVLVVFFVLNLWGSYRLSQLDQQEISHPLRHYFQSALGREGDRRSNGTSLHGQPTHHACEGWNGVLHIKMGDIGGAAGTIFFQFVIGQLIYAEQYRLLPWIHFDNTSNVIYDEKVHGSGPGFDHRFKGTGRAIDIVRPDGYWRDRIPGPPKFPPADQTGYIDMHFNGTGVWNHYFEPVSLFVPGEKSCQTKPYVTLTLKQITPGIHGFVFWAPRCWRYHYLPDYITKPHIPLHEWLRPSQLLGNAAVRKYIKFRPHIIKAAEAANPHCTSEAGNKCLGMHIRHSDKAAGRRQIPVSEFLPYAQAFVHAGGKYIYLATDSTLVLKEISESWPIEIRSKIRSLGDDQGSMDAVARSSDSQAVFDIASHHRTNQEILIEIKALSMCRFLVHGLSAVSESAIWLNRKLISSSVELEDPDHLNSPAFGTLVQMVLRGEGEDHPEYLPKPKGSSKWWKVRPEAASRVPQCSNALGVLRIAFVGGDDVEAPAAFFTRVLNQIIYAEKHNLLPFAHLELSKKAVIYDRWAHEYTNVTIDATDVLAIDVDAEGIPKQPRQSESSLRSTRVLLGNGLWESYFEPLVGFDPSDPECGGLPLVELPSEAVTSIVTKAPWAVRAWRYDSVPDHLWKPANASMKEWYASSRSQARRVVDKYFRFRPYLKKRAQEVNSPDKGEICLSVHLRMGKKNGQHRQKVGSKTILPFIQEFVRAGGNYVYVGTDSSRALQFIQKNFPANLTRLIRTQGDQVVRTSKEWPLPMIDNHHRVNGEALVEALAMSQCQFLLHSHSTLAEVAIYLNSDLEDNSINLEDSTHLSVAEFSAIIHEMVHRTKQERHQKSGESVESLQTKAVVRKQISNVTLVFRDVGRECRRNALVYLAQKKHSSYKGRDSYSILLRSLDLVKRNYLSINRHIDNLDIFIFHTNDFDEADLRLLEDRLGSDFFGVIRFVDLTNSPFWRRPPHHAHDDPNTWYAYPLFSEGYRRMMHFFAIDIWDFFEALNHSLGCSYRYIFRLDEDSYIHSPIHYDIFDLMESQSYVYGFRMCSYEMPVTRRMWTLYKKRFPEFVPQRDIVDYEKTCGFYNNFFVADLHFFRSEPVKKFLHFIDRQGQIYRRRLGDLMIHTMGVYSFARESQIHRFLDFTYEHGTFNHTSGCLAWGGIQAGWNDTNATSIMSQYYQENLLDRNCVARSTILGGEDLSPTYAHIPPKLEGAIALQTITAGRVESYTG